MKFTEEQNWERFKKFYCEFPAVGLSVDLSRTRMESRFVEEMQPKLQKAMKATRTTSANRTMLLIFIFESSAARLPQKPNGNSFWPLP